jgi:hypothetical protein
MPLFAAWQGKGGTPVVVSVLTFRVRRVFLVYLVCSVYLACLVCLVYLVGLVYLIGLVRRYFISPEITLPDLFA